MICSFSRITKADSSVVDRWQAYAVFRLTLGVNILIHGVGRLFGSGAGEFAAKTSSEFVATPLPHSFVYVFLVILPFVETILGMLLVLGLFTRWMLTLGGLLIAALVFGTALRSDWPTAGIQMIYAIIYYLLLKNLADNYFSADTLLRRYHKAAAPDATAFSHDRACARDPRSLEAARRLSPTALKEEKS